jgi:CTP:molybdopterin cytidylyltransferase MocA
LFHGARHKRRVAFFSRRLAAELLALNGDTGAQKLIVENKDICVPVPVQDDGILRDIDLPTDLLKIPLYRGANRIRTDAD